MDKRRLFWTLFLGGSLVLAAIPEFWPDEETAAVAPVARPAATAPVAAAAAPLESLRADPAAPP
ncbi:MAG: secretion system X translation initiation factor, partial [Betaproteobacteria bacterium HGW-Betaproteobacteria-12]